MAVVPSSSSAEHTANQFRFFLFSARCATNTDWKQLYCPVCHWPFCIAWLQKTATKKCMTPNIIFSLCQAKSKMFSTCVCILQFHLKQGKELNIFEKSKKLFLALVFYGQDLCKLNTSPMTTTTTPKWTPQAGHPPVGGWAGLWRSTYTLIDYMYPIYLTPM